MAFKTFDEAQRVAVEKAKRWNKTYLVIYDDEDEDGYTGNDTPYYVNSEDNWHIQSEDGGPDFSPNARVLFSIDGEGYWEFLDS